MGKKKKNREYYLNRLSNKEKVDEANVPGRSVPAVESWKSAEAEGVAECWTERWAVLEEVPGLVLQGLNSSDCVHDFACPVHAGRRLDH